MIPSEQYHELSFYTLAHPDSIRFIHQHIVDSYTAQTADIKTKKISLVYSLIGLYLTIEKKYTGRQVQQIHMELSKNKNELPSIILPEKRGDITISQVLSATPGLQRDEMIQKWCFSVWEAYYEEQKTILNYFNDSILKLTNNNVFHSRN